MTYIVFLHFTFIENSFPSTLNYAVLYVVNNAVCIQDYGEYVITNNTLCVSTPDAISTCGGDSGGPLSLYSSKLLIGVTSFGSQLGCTSRIPVGFVRVTSYLDWIKTHTGIFY